MNIKSITSVAGKKTFELTRKNEVQNNLLGLYEHLENGQCVRVTEYIVTNEAATARLIHFKCEDFDGTAGDLADYKNMIALLTQG